MEMFAEILEFVCVLCGILFVVLLPIAFLYYLLRICRALLKILENHSDRKKIRDFACDEYGDLNGRLHSYFYLREKGAKLKRGNAKVSRERPRSKPISKIRQKEVR